MLAGLTPRLVAAFVLAAAVFLLWPGIDLWIARQFHDGQRFPLGRWESLEELRNLIWNASILTALAALALLLAWLPLGRGAAVPARLWGWVVAVYVVGPGLLVNALLKDHWGRARPAAVLGGEGTFTPPFVISDQCARNCSFVSGEASAAVALAIVFCTLLWPHLGERGRVRAVAFLGLIAAAAGLMRVATGRHFLSDVVFAGFLTAFVALALWHLMRVRPARDALTVAALRRDLRRLNGACGRGWRRLAG